ncbi:MAG: hypothetical protein RSE47_05490 [Acidaminococcaceae bacterium]
MNWQQLKNKLLLGSKNDISKLSCPECGGRLHCHYDGSGRLLVLCEECKSGFMESADIKRPKFVEYFGTDAVL